MHSTYTNHTRYFAKPYTLHLPTVHITSPNLFQQYRLPLQTMHTTSPNHTHYLSQSYTLPLRNRWLSERTCTVVVLCRELFIDYYQETIEPFPCLQLTRLFPQIVYKEEWQNRTLLSITLGEICHS